ncbi:hypothetical protein EMIT036CA2_10054 [Chryseobacterium sp. IT-36CA2]
MKSSSRRKEKRLLTLNSGSADEIEKLDEKKIFNDSILHISYSQLYTGSKRQ